MSQPETILVCGGRDYGNYSRLRMVLDEYLQSVKTVVQGHARGADRMAQHWAKQNGIKCKTYPALWSTHGRSAGPIRNQQMLDEENIDLVIAFPGGNGTADMVRRAKAQGYPVLEIEQ